MPWRSTDNSKLIVILNSYFSSDTVQWGVSEPGTSYRDLSLHHTRDSWLLLGSYQIGIMYDAYSSHLKFGRRVMRNRDFGYNSDNGDSFVANQSDPLVPRFMNKLSPPTAIIVAIKITKMDSIGDLWQWCRCRLWFYCCQQHRWNTWSPSTLLQLAFVWSPFIINFVAIKMAKKFAYSYH